MIKPICKADWKKLVILLSLYVKHAVHGILKNTVVVTTFTVKKFEIKIVIYRFTDIKLQLSNF
jgi:hypothetical protein